MTTFSTVRRVLRDRSAGLCLATTVVSGFGSSALWLASGVWVKDITGSDGLAALCVFALWAPTLAGPALGALADRMRRRPLMITTNLFLAALLLPLTTVDSPARLWLLFAVLFLYGAADAVHDVAESALVGAAVDPELLGAFNGLRMTAREGMKLLAPLAGAGLYTVYGGPAVALLDAATFVLAAALCALLRVREGHPARASHPKDVAGAGAGIALGLRHVWGHPALRPLVMAASTTMVLAALNGATVYAVVDRLGRAPAYAGVLYAAQGVGSVVIGVAAGPLLARLGGHRFAAGGIALTAVAVAARTVPSAPVALAAGAVAGLGLPCALIAVFTAVQRETPEDLLGRASAAANTLVFAPNVLGLALGAALVGTADLRLLLPLYALPLLATAALLAQCPDRASRTAARSPSDANPA
ncbi:MFS transporter [Streptomyces sp. NPDC059575]|uniref:MFS transporter n=1 Tax=Streptomyces sp. NPDC059575 TaxID=3346872 RepID=UPI00369D95AB